MASKIFWHYPVVNNDILASKLFDYKSSAVLNSLLRISFCWSVTDLRFEKGALIEPIEGCLLKRGGLRI